MTQPSGAAAIPSGTALHIDNSVPPQPVPPGSGIVIFPDGPGGEGPGGGYSDPTVWIQPGTQLFEASRVRFSADFDVRVNGKDSAFISSPSLQGQVPRPLAGAPGSWSQVTGSYQFGVQLAVDAALFAFAISPGWTEILVMVTSGAPGSPGINNGHGYFDVFEISPVPQALSPLGTYDFQMPPVPIPPATVMCMSVGWVFLEGDKAANIYVSVSQEGPGMESVWVLSGIARKIGAL